MAAAHPQALQDTFLDHVRKHDVPVTVFLANGIRLQGTVAGFDSYALLLVRDRQSQLIYKHAISTIVPSEPDREPDRMAQVSDRPGTSQDGRSRPA
jgi:host factor-I protein